MKSHMDHGKPPETLPAELPIFPLTGTLLLPEMVLPLHIFEPRYRSMVADARDGVGMIGMVQPLVPQEDNRPPAGATPENPEVYPVGCAGYIWRMEEFPDGRFLVILMGLTRFRIREELPLHEGYRRVVPDYAPFAGDLHPEREGYDGGKLLETINGLKAANALPMEYPDDLKMTPRRLLNGMCMALPLLPVEKQSLLESPSYEERETLLIKLLNMGVRKGGDDAPVAPPVLN